MLNQLFTRAIYSFIIKCNIWIV